MKKNIGTVSIIASIVLASFLFMNAKKDLDPLTKENVSAASLWKRISVEADYHKYSYWPGHDGMKPGRAPHGPFNRVFVNSQILEALPIADKKVPLGGIIVKEGYDIDKEFNNISVMVKVKDYDTNEDDWYWAQYTPEGKVMSSGKVETCINCHKAFAKNDLCIIYKLDKK
jgi:hypothetical protein